MAYGISTITTPSCCYSLRALHDSLAVLRILFAIFSLSPSSATPSFFFEKASSHKKCKSDISILCYKMRIKISSNFWCRRFIAIYFFLIIFYWLFCLFCWVHPKLLNLCNQTCFRYNCLLYKLSKFGCKRIRRSKTVQTLDSWYLIFVMAKLDLSAVLLSRYSQLLTAHLIQQ